MILLLSDSQVDGVGWSEPDFGSIALAATTRNVLEFLLGSGCVPCVQSQSKRAQSGQPNCIGQKNPNGPGSAEEKTASELTVASLLDASEGRGSNAETELDSGAWPQPTSRHPVMLARVNPEAPQSARSAVDASPTFAGSGIESCGLVARRARRERVAATVCDPSNVVSSSIPLLFKSRLLSGPQELEFVMAEDLQSGASNQANASVGFEKGVTAAEDNVDGAAAVTFAPWGGDATEFEMAKHAEHKSPSLSRKNAGSLWHREQSGSAQDAPCASSLAARGVSGSHVSQKTPAGVSRVAVRTRHSSHFVRVWSAVSPIMLAPFLCAKRRGEFHARS